MVKQLDLLVVRGCKSALATLIPRFWDVTEGSVKIGGIDVRDMSESDIMDNVSFVFQNTNLYKMSILDNVKEGKPNATENEVIDALKLARCEGIIAKLPNKIILLEDGKVDEEGNHNELMKFGENYSNMVNLQIKSLNLKLV